MNETDEVEIIVPAGADESEVLDFSLVALTQAIDQLDPDKVAHGFLGGEHGYGAHWDNDVFEMRPFYWGDCDCGAGERSDKWHAANPHSDECFSTVLHARFAKYDEESGYSAIDKAAFGDEKSLLSGFDTQSESPAPGVTTLISMPRKDAAMERWREASDKRTNAHARLSRELYDERGLKRSPYQWLCTCGVDEKAKVYFSTESHYPACALTLPNFRHKPSGLEIRWYKYIGRDMEVTNADGADVAAIFRECIASLSPASAQSDR